MGYTNEELEALLLNYKMLLKTNKSDGGLVIHSYRLTDILKFPVVITVKEDAKENERVILAIERTYSSMKTDLRFMIELYYFNRPYGMQEKQLAERLNTDRTNLWRWRRKVCYELRKQLEGA